MIRRYLARILGVHSVYPEFALASINAVLAEEAHYYLAIWFCPHCKCSSYEPVCGYGCGVPTQAYRMTA